MQDPFDTAPADEVEAGRVVNPIDTQAHTPKRPNEVLKSATPVVNVGSSEGKVVLTFKGGSGFDAPWIVIHAADLDDALAQVSGENASTLAELMERSQAAGQKFAGLAPAKTNSQPRQAPPEAQSAPAGAPPAPGPDWTFKSGVSAKNGKPWKGWMPPRGSGESPVFF